MKKLSFLLLFLTVIILLPSCSVKKSGSGERRTTSPTSQSETTAAATTTAQTTTAAETTQQTVSQVETSNMNSLIFQDLPLTFDELQEKYGKAINLDKDDGPNCSFENAPFFPFKYFFKNNIDLLKGPEECIAVRCPAQTLFEGMADSINIDDIEAIYGVEFTEKKVWDESEMYYTSKFQYENSDVYLYHEDENILEGETLVFVKRLDA